MRVSVRFRLVAGLILLAAPAVVQAQNAKPETHTVKKGDTLWDLAQLYLGDPLLWPEIYRMNTNVVEDPHWIYPGEVLRLVAGPDVSAVPPTETPAPPPPQQMAVDTTQPAETTQVAAADTAAPADSAAPVEEEPAAPGLAEPQVGDIAAADTTSYSSTDSVDLSPLVGDTRRMANPELNLEVGLRRLYKPIRRSEFYSSGFLTERQVLPLGDLLGTVTPLQIEEVSTRNTAQLYARVAVTPPEGAKYQVGDTLLSVIVKREIEGYGNVIEPTGLLRVVDVSRPQNVAQVIASYGPVRNGQRVLPAEKFNDPGHVRPVPISDGVKARVLGNRDVQPLTGPQDVVFLDRGRKDGVALGDIFELRQAPRERPGMADVIDEPMATVQVVHVGEGTCTARVVKLTHPNIPSGTEARQIAKLPS
jgi:LysM domain